MTLKDLQKAYESSSGKVSELVRYLGFAGIAVIWIFKKDSGAGQSLPSALRVPTILLLSGLILDLLQYFSHSISYYVYFRCREKIKDATGDTVFVSPVWLPTIFWIVWFLKAIFIVTAYIFLLVFLKSAIAFQ